MTKVKTGTIVKNKPGIFKRVINDVVKYRVLIAFLLPGLIILFINNYMPMFGLGMAFKSMDNSLGFFKSPWVGFENFKFLFQSDDVRIVTRNTLIYSLTFIVLSVVLNVGLAICVTELKSRRCAKLYQTILVLPYFFSFVMIACIANAFLSTSNGYLNNVLQKFGISRIDWYSEPKYWPVIMVIVYFWRQCGYGAIIYIATITGFDQQIYEAAVVDGANRLQKIFYITIPMLKQTMVVLTILALGNIFRGNFDMFYQVPMNSPLLYPTTDVIDTYVYRSLTSMPDIGMTTAAGMFQSVVGCVMVVAVNLIVRRIDKDSALF